MKKLFYLAFCLTAALSLGCVTIVYPTITDNDGSGVSVVNTNGKAHIIESSQTSSSVGGKRFEHVAFVDQAAGGSQKLTDYDLELAAGSSNFHSDTYCNPDWTGCAWFTNNYTPPGDCTFYGAGSKLNLNCLQFSVLGVCFSSRPGECGRAVRTVKNLRGSEISSLIGMGVENGTNLTFNFNANTAHITLQNPQGSVSTMKLAGNTEATLNLNKGLLKVDMSSPTYAVNVRKLASLIDSGFKTGSAQLTYGNVTRTVNYGLLSGDVYRKMLLARGQ